MSAGARFRQALEKEVPLQVVGTINAYHALLATASGYRAIYLSGGGVAAASCGLPDLGITTLEDVLVDVRRITAACNTPLLVDIDSGWGGPFNIARAIRSLEQAGAAGVHIEDQVIAKRCGHRPHKQLVPINEMVGRIKAATQARQSKDFVIMARTDALAVEGMGKALERVAAYVNAGADMIFPEAVNTLAQYRQFTSTTPVPVLANITEFGVTPLFTTTELAQAGISLVLYPLSAFRAMNQAALEVFQQLREQGTQKSLLEKMQSREELYQYLHYHDYEDKLNALQAENLQKKDP
ncbi:Methylisocitrate lyase [Pseudovibrio axinellae]|uniref:2-methylisocitrate lyase n=1 Tax=Pseudovibrio axinellae TaxID=989403 RepID=A0A165YM76_9HYPH|nr:methylisocitrate lyase [Pseudovibrio axinellae]KZL18977.1 Methylisocitrate lyase [Pseudovibrio axinellae]SEP85398.1 methylisocitrate lyase [Pseudovibrio axinellae]